MSPSAYASLRWYVISIVVLLSDLGTKYMAVLWLEPYQPQVITSFFNFTLAFNRGAAFSFLSEASGWQRWFFVILGLVVSVVIIAWIRRLGSGEQRTAAGLSLILGGALGNVSDRVSQGQVTDFLDVHYLAWHWPTFNVADSAITVGVVLLLVDSVLSSRKEAQGR